MRITRFVTMPALLLTLGILGNPPAEAEPIVDGFGFLEGDSWTLNTGCFGLACGTWDTIEVFITFDSGGVGPFEPPGIGNFGPSLSGFTGSRPNSLYALATGPGNGGSSDNAFDLFFAGSPLGTIELDYLFWSGGIFGTLVVAGDAQVVDGEFSEAGLGGPSELEFPDGVGYDRSSSVPEPGTLLLLGSGLLGLVTWHRRSRVREV